MNKNAFTERVKVSSVQVRPLSSSGNEFETMGPAAENAQRDV